MTVAPVELRATDPMERILEAALREAGAAFGQGPENMHRLDFHLTGPNVAVEVKQMHSPRIAEQMSRVPDVVAVQGRAAVEWLAGLIRGAAERDRLRESLSDIFAHYSDRDQGPGHDHDVPGVWDSDNAPGIAGTRCEWCGQWERARALLSTHGATLSGRERKAHGR